MTNATGFGNNALGIDVSYTATWVNWEAVKASGFSFAFVKATEGVGTFDDQFHNYWPGARAAGLLRGGYHFFHPTEDPLVQAQHFTSMVQRGQSDLPPALDIEDYRAIVTADNMAANFGRVRTWLEAVEGALQLKPLIYTRAGFWNDVIHRLGGQVPGWLGGYQLWVANWFGHFTDGVTKPVLPAGWSNWTFWQFGSPDNVGGIPIDIAAFTDDADIDFYNGTEDQLRASIGESTGQPTKTFFTGTNQDVINVFFEAFGEPDYFDVKMVNAGLAHLADDREAPYSGPAVEDLPNLSDADRQALLGVLLGVG